uniref:Secreted protein n=1 Tax=Panagrellus redivivus TaxID=6233 RepID=A0A7E4VKG8_PANRE
MYRHLAVVHMLALADPLPSEGLLPDNLLPLFIRSPTLKHTQHIWTFCIVYVGHSVNQSSSAGCGTTSFPLRLTVIVLPQTYDVVVMKAVSDIVIQNSRIEPIESGYVKQSAQLSVGSRPGLKKRAFQHPKCLGFACKNTFLATAVCRSDVWHPAFQAAALERALRVPG